MTRDEAWHVPRDVLAAYVADRASEPDAWSVEAHLVRCEDCRTRLGLLVETSPLAAVLDRSRADLGVVIGAQDLGAGAQPGWAGWAGSPVHLMARSLGRWPWLVAVLAASAVAVAFSALAGEFQPQGGTFLLVWSLAPVVPLAGVAATFTRRSDPCAEVVLSTPVQGLALVLWRCAAVLALSAPLTLAAGWAGATASAGMSLTAMLGLTLVVLALGTRIGLEQAAMVVAGLWGTVMVAPLLLRAQPWFDALSASTLPAWIAAMVACAGMLFVRRDAFERLPMLMGGPR